MNILRRIIAVAFTIGIGHITGFIHGVWWARDNVSDCEIPQTKIDESKLGI